MTEPKETSQTDKSVYERPLLVVYGDATDLTRTGVSGDPELGSNSGQKKTSSAI